MRLARLMLCAVPTAALVAACGSSPGPVAVTSPPPPPVTGAVVAPPDASAPGLSGSSVPPSDQATGNGAVPLSASDALALLANNTALGITDAGLPYEAYFSNNGAVHLREPTLNDTGTWRVLPNGEVCSRLSQINSGAENCYTLSRYGDVILFSPRNGPAIGSIRVVAGNPRNL